MGQQWDDLATLARDEAGKKEHGATTKSVPQGPVARCRCAGGWYYVDPVNPCAGREADLVCAYCGDRFPWRAQP